jgi:hypothetical protein
MAITASENYSLSVPAQLADGITSATHKWLALQNNVLDGSYHPLPSDGSAQIGWWGTTLSNGLGVISTNPTVTLTMTAMNCSLLILSGDSLLEEYPVDFDYIVKNAGGTTLDSGIITGNTQVTRLVPFNVTCIAATSIMITIHKINKSSTVAKLLELSTGIQLNCTDTILVKTSEVLSSTTNQLVRGDSILPKITDNTLMVTNELTMVTDNILVEVTEFIPLKAFTTCDSILPKLLDTANITNKLSTCTDILSLAIVDTRLSIVNKFTAQESIKLKIVDDTESITNKLPVRVDNIQYKIIDSSDIKNIHTMMRAPVREILGKVEIQYTDPMFDSAAIVTTTDANRISNKLQVIDGRMQTEFKWFSFANNKLDGTFHAPDTSSSIGWWGNTLPNALGVFTVPQTIVLDIAPRMIGKLILNGDKLLDNYPVDFDINLYREAALVYTETIRGNTFVEYYKEIIALGGITKMEAKIYSVNTQSVCKVIEFFSMVSYEYEGGKDLISIDMLEELGYIDSSIQLGSISSNEIDVQLRNQNQTFNLDNPSSLLYGLLRKNRKVIAWLGTVISPQVGVEWYKLGTFWTTSWSAPFAGVAAYTTARDILELLRGDTFSISQLYINYSLYQLFDIVLKSYKTMPLDFVIDPILQTIIIPYAWFNIMTIREALARLASCATVNIFCDREGVINVKYIGTGTEGKVDFALDSHIVDINYPNMGQQLTNSVVVKVNNLTANPLGNIYSNNVAVKIPANKVLDITCYYTSIPCNNVQTPIVSMDSGLIILEIKNYVWGSIIKVNNPSAQNKNVNSISIDGVSWNINITGSALQEAADSILTEGKMQVAVNHDFIQTMDYANTLATSLLARYKNQNNDVNLKTIGDIAVFIGEDITVSSEHSSKIPYTIFRQDIHWAGSLEVDMECKKI